MGTSCAPHSVPFRLPLLWRGDAKNDAVYPNLQGVSTSKTSRLDPESRVDQRVEKEVGMPPFFPARARRHYHSVLGPMPNPPNAVIAEPAGTILPQVSQSAESPSTYDPSS